MFFGNVSALRARSILPSDILEFLDRAFTQKGLKENVLGRKKRNYPKRSAIIKVNRVTGEYSYPGESKEKVAILTIKVFFLIEVVLLIEVIPHCEYLKIGTAQFVRKLLEVIFFIPR